MTAKYNETSEGRVSKVSSNISSSFCSQPQRAKGASLTIMATLYNTSESVTSFLSAFSNDRILFQTFKDSGSSDTSLLSMFGTSVNKLPIEKLETLNQQGAGIFFTVNETKGDKRQEAEVTAIRAFFVDMDGKEPDPKGLEQLPAPSIVVQSKNGKHLYWLLQEPLAVVDTAEAKKLFKSYQQALAALLGGDTKVSDLARCMRVPGFNHMKDASDPTMVKVLENNQLRYALANFPLPEENIKPATSSKTVVSRDRLLDKLHTQKSKVATAKTGERNDTLNKAAFSCSSLVKQGLAPEEITEALLNAAMYVGLEEAEARITIESGLNKGLEKSNRNDAPVNKFAALMASLKDQFAGRIKYNEATTRPELDGKPSTSEAIELMIRCEVAEDISKQDAQDFVRDELKLNSYHPAAEWMQNLKPAEKIELLPQLSKLIFGTDSGLASTYVQRWFIGAVARLLDPGCKMDTALVLTGGQGKGKTTFFEALVKPGWFNTMEAQDRGKDELMTLHKFWLVEMGELESTFSARDVSVLKAFFTKPVDTYRAPYERDTLSHPRRFVFCASTNKPEFLVDDTGNRRFWVIDIKDHKIEVQWVREHAEILWAEAKKLYLDKEQWWLTEKEQELSNRDNLNYSTRDPQEELVEQKLPRLFQEMGNAALTTTQLAALMWGVTADRVNKSHANKMGKIMRKLGYELQVKKYCGVAGKYWVHESWDTEEKPKMLSSNDFIALFEKFAKAAN